MTKYEIKVEHDNYPSQKGWNSSRLKKNTYNGSNQEEGNDKGKKDITITTITNTTNNKNDIAGRNRSRGEVITKTTTITNQKNQPTSLGHRAKEETVTTTKTNKELN